MKAIFVAGTDTGVGKTVITGLLAGRLLERGFSVVTQKWVETGSPGPSADIRSHIKLMGRKRSDFGAHLPLMAPYVLRMASSPHLAAGVEQKKVRSEVIIKSLRRLSEDFDYVVVEGTGGLLVPLTGNTLIIDQVRKLGLPVLLVSENRLGTINHTLLSIEAMRSRRMRIIGIVFNDISRKPTAAAILRDNPKTVKKLSGVEILGRMPYSGDKACLKRKFASIADRIIRKTWKVG